MTFIILEGPDGAGKTTLAKEARHLEYIHFGPPPKGKNSAWRQYYALLEDLWDNPRPGGVILDRFIYGELIYGPILRGGTDLTWAHVRMLERIIMGMSGLLVVCLPPWDEVLRNWGLSKDELINRSDTLFEVYTWYQNLLKDQRRMIPRKIFDYTDRNKDDMYGEGVFPNKGPGIGLFCPGNTLLMGEEVNANRGKEGWPFVAPDSSSLWLAQQLDNAKIPEHGLYWANATTNREDTDPRFIDELEPDLVVAMGGKAQMWCKRHGIKHSRVNHPQWHKRFKYNEIYPLIELIR